ncbi:MAG: hypothetical protein ACLSA6_06970 [Holdemania massiliensis]
MPGSFKKNTALGAVPRPIHSDLKSKRIVWETEHPVRWSFMKILRETSSLKQFYQRSTRIPKFIKSAKVCMRCITTASMVR